MVWFVIRKLVGLGGFEPPTSPLSGVRSNQLSYRPGVYGRVCTQPSPYYYLTFQLDNNVLYDMDQNSLCGHLRQLGHSLRR